MSILDNKDSQRLEILRPYQASDPLYFSVLNRPLEDLNQRDADNNSHFFPARGFRCRQTLVPSVNVEVEVGVYWVNDTTTATTAVQTLAIAASTLGNIRIDLVYLDLSNGVANVVAGVGVPAGGGFGTATPAPIPANNGVIPLAYLYVNDVPTPFDETISINNAGHIRNIRPSLGTQLRLFENNVANLKNDVTGGALGSNFRTVRSDHQHPLNVNDASQPQVLGPSVTSDAGGDAYYARRDHRHAINKEGNAAAFQKDGVASAGSSANFPRADHIHPANVDAVNPVDVSASAAAPGASLVYSRRDHVHRLPSHLIKAVGWFGGRHELVGVADFVVTTSCSMGATVIVPANTFPHGILIYSYAEMGVDPNFDSGTILSLEVHAVQGITTKRIAGDPVSPYIAVIGSGFPTLGGNPLVLLGWDNVNGTPSTLYQRKYQQMSTIGVWAAGGFGGITNGGGNDWNPAASTTIDFANCYIAFAGGAGPGRIGQRGIYVVGF
jgi:hypothetical protein